MKIFSIILIVFSLLNFAFSHTDHSLIPQIPIDANLTSDIFQDLNHHLSESQTMDMGMDMDMMMYMYFYASIKVDPLLFEK